MTKNLEFKLRLGEDERRQLEELAEHLSTSAATVVRLLIKEKHAALDLGSYRVSAWDGMTTTTLLQVVTGRQAAIDVANQLAAANQGSTKYSCIRVIPMATQEPVHVAMVQR